MPLPPLATIDTSVFPIKSTIFMASRWRIHREYFALRGDILSTAHDLFFALFWDCPDELVSAANVICPKQIIVKMVRNKVLFSKSQCIKGSRCFSRYRLDVKIKV